MLACADSSKQNLNEENLNNGQHFFYLIFLATTINGLERLHDSQGDVFYISFAKNIFSS